MIILFSTVQISLRRTAITDDGANRNLHIHEASGYVNEFMSRELLETFGDFQTEECSEIAAIHQKRTEMLASLNQNRGNIFVYL